jgi:hypothetical protein
MDPPLRSLYTTPLLWEEMVQNFHPTPPFITRKEDPSILQQPIRLHTWAHLHTITRGLRFHTFLLTFHTIPILLHRKELNLPLRLP